MATRGERAAFNRGLKHNKKRDWTDNITGNPPYDPPKNATHEEKRQYDRAYYDRHSQKP
jgi:hypothetical protein